MKFAYICTNYNNTAYTRQAVASLARFADQCRIVVVDNNSKAENVEALRSVARDYSIVELVLSPQNVGYFPGLNLGIRHLRANHPDIELVVIGNEDLVFPEDFAASLETNRYLFDKYPVVSPDIITMDGMHQNPYVIHGISRFRDFVYDVYYASYPLAILIQHFADWSRRVTARKDFTLHEVAQEIYIGLGACYILGPIFFDRFAELSAPSFLVHEEFFFSKQLNDKGFRIFYEPSIRVLHHWRTSMQTFGSRRNWEFGREAHRLRRQIARMSG